MIMDVNENPWATSQAVEEALLWKSTGSKTITVIIKNQQGSDYEYHLYPLTYVS